MSCLKISHPLQPHLPVFLNVFLIICNIQISFGPELILITVATCFVDRIICLLTASLSHIYLSFQPCFEINKQIGLRSREIASSRYSTTNLTDKADLEHLSMTAMKIMSNNNNSENKVMV